MLYGQQTVLLFKLKQKISRMIMQMLLKKDLIHQIMNAVDHYLQEKIKKVIGLKKDELGVKIMKIFDWEISK